MVIGKSIQAGPVPQRHTPLVQLSALLPQSAPHAPQWSVLLVTSMQMPVQQRSPAPQAAPQTPQFISVLVVVHIPEQQLWPAGHETPVPQRHTPMSQTSPGAQGVGHGISLVHAPPMHI